MGVFDRISAKSPVDHFIRNLLKKPSLEQMSLTCLLAVLLFIPLLYAYKEFFHSDTTNFAKLFQDALDIKIVIRLFVLSAAVIIAKIILNSHTTKTIKARAIFLVFLVSIVSGFWLLHTSDPGRYCLPKYIANGLLACPDRTWWSSFPGNTRILLTSSLRSMDQLQIGDLVQSFDLENKKQTMAKVEKIFKYSADNFIVLNGNLKVTPKHPFAVFEKNKYIWKKAEELLYGDCIYEVNGNCEIITRIDIERIPSEIVYNIQVSWPHNYFVNIDNTYVLVHNKTIPN